MASTEDDAIAFFEWLRRLDIAAREHNNVVASIERIPSTCLTSRFGANRIKERAHSKRPGHLVRKQSDGPVAEVVECGQQGEDVEIDRTTKSMIAHDKRWRTRQRLRDVNLQSVIPAHKTDTQVPHRNREATDQIICERRRHCCGVRHCARFPREGTAFHSQIDIMSIIGANAIDA